MSPSNVAEWPQMPKFHETRAIRVVSHCHAGLKQNSRPCLGREFRFVRWLLCLAQFKPQSCLVVACEHNHDGLRIGERSFQNLADVRRGFAGKSDGLCPFNRFQSNGAQKSEHPVAQSNVPAVDYEYFGSPTRRAALFLGCLLSAAPP